MFECSSAKKKYFLRKSIVWVKKSSIFSVKIHRKQQNVGWKTATLKCRSTALLKKIFDFEKCRKSAMFEYWDTAYQKLTFFKCRDQGRLKISNVDVSKMIIHRVSEFSNFCVLKISNGWVSKISNGRMLKIRVELIINIIWVSKLVSIEYQRSASFKCRTKPNFECRLSVTQECRTSVEN